MHKQDPASEWRVNPLLTGVGPVAHRECCRDGCFQQEPPLKGKGTVESLMEAHRTGFPGSHGYKAASICWKRVGRSRPPGRSGIAPDAAAHIGSPNQTSTALPYLRSYWQLITSGRKILGFLRTSLLVRVNSI